MLQRPLGVCKKSSQWLVSSLRHFCFCFVLLFLRDMDKSGRPKGTFSLWWCRFTWRFSGTESTAPDVTIFLRFVPSCQLHDHRPIFLSAGLIFQYPLL